MDDGQKAFPLCVRWDNEIILLSRDSDLNHSLLDYVTVRQKGIILNLYLN